MRLAKKGYLQSRNQTKTRLHFRKTKRSLNLSKRSLYGNVTFPFLFQGDRTAELPSLCNVVSSIYQLFVPHFALAVFMCIYLHYRINKQRDTSFEFSSILSTVDLSKHLIAAWIIRKFIQLVNFVTSSVFFFFFGNRVWLSLYERALSGNELLSQKRLP